MAGVVRFFTAKFDYPRLCPFMFPMLIRVGLIDRRAEQNLLTLVSGGL